MGKKKKKTRKLAKKVDAAIRDKGISRADIMHAGLGVLASAVEKGKKKRFRNARLQGRALAKVGTPVTTEIVSEASQDDTTTRDGPVIGYRPNGGGWYDVEVGSTVVARVQGEEEAASRAGQLLERFAGLDASDQASGPTGVREQGGGWYTIQVEGVPLERVRGRDAAEEAIAKIAALNAGA